jgi:hypothetical protein
VPSSYADGGVVYRLPAEPNASFAS